MFLSRALGAALMAVPLAAAAGQSAPQLHAPPAPASDSGNGHRFAWVAGAGVASAALFTTFVHLSDQRGGTSAALNAVAPGTPVPNRYTDAFLPGTDSTTGQDTPPPTDSTSQGSTDTVGGDPLPDIIDNPIPPPNQFLTVTNTTTDQGGTDDPPSPPPPGPETALAVVITTPEPESITLLGTGLIALAPLVRRRRTRAAG